MASAMKYTLNHHVAYFLVFRKGSLALVSRATPPFEDDFEHQIRVTVMEDTKAKEAFGSPRFVIWVHYPQDHRNNEFVMSLPTQMPKQDFRHGVTGRAIIDLGPTFVVLEVTCNVGSFFGEHEWRPDDDTAECV